MGNCHICEGPIDAERFIQGFRATYAAIPDVCLRDVPDYFRETMQRHIVDVFQQRVFVVKEFRYQTDLPAVQTCLPLKMCGAL